MTSYFKVVRKDEREVEELLATQLSRNSSRASSLESAKTLSTLSSAVMSIVDLTTDLFSSDLISPALSAIIADYESDNDVRDDEQPEGDVEFIGTVANRNSGFVGDAVINALDAVISGIEPVIKDKNSGIPWYIFLIYSFEMDRCYNG